MTLESENVPVRNGMVEVFERREIKGWVEVDPDAGPVRVTMWINDEEVVGTWAGKVGGRRTLAQIRHFRFSVSDFWRFAKRTDRVTVRAADKILPILNRGTHYQPWVGGEESIDILHELRASGHVFAQDGRLRLSKTVDAVWQNDVMSLYRRVGDALRGKFELDAFLCYGSLLGAIRENGFIGHDLDFDAAYISNHTEPADVTAEALDISLALIDSGFHVIPKWSCVAVTDQATPDMKIDLFYLFFDNDGNISFPFGVAGKSKYTKSDFQGLKEISFAGETALVPQDGESFIEHVYGDKWRTPNPGFSWNQDRTTRADQALLTAAQKEEIYWADFYAVTEYTSGSTFHDYVANQRDLPSTVMDIGCGDGRDAFAFAKSGFSVLGVDRSHIGVRHANKKVQDSLPDAHASFEACDVSDSDRLTGLISDFRAKNPGPINFYARFFFHSIPADVQDSLLTTLGSVSEPGDYLSVEFRTDKDEKNTKVHGKHFRRFQNATEFLESLPKYNFEPLVSQEGNGFSPYKGEDPQLLRVVAKRAEFD